MIGNSGYLKTTLWQQLQNTEGDEEFYSAWLYLQCQMLDDVHRAAIFVESQKGSSEAIATWPAIFSAEKSFLSVVERVKKEGKGIVLQYTKEKETSTADRRICHLAYPIVEGEEFSGVVVLEIVDQSEQKTEIAKRQLQWGVIWLRHRFLSQKTDKKSDSNRIEELQSVLEVLSIAIQETGYPGAALALVTEMATRLNCDRVSIGFAMKNQIKIAAISHSTEFNRQMNLAHDLEKVMGESVDQGKTLTYPASSCNEFDILYSHEDFVRKHGLASLLTVPFFSKDGMILGAILFERSEQLPFTQNTTRFCEAIAALSGPIIHEKKENNRSLFAILTDRANSIFRKIFGSKHVLLKTLCSGAILLAIFLSVAKGMYRIHGEMVLEGTIQRSVITPFDGFLLEAIPRAGDLVKKDQPLAQLETRELLLERLRWNSKKKQHHLEYKKAISQNNNADSQIIVEQIHQADSQIALLDEQLFRSSIRSPFDGLIIRGDLSQSIGTPLERGQVLFEIAPLHSYRIMIDIDEKDIDQLVVGQRGNFVVNALPQSSFTFTLEEVIPVATAKDGRTIFRVEGKLEDTSERLRPGMHGYAKISVEKRKLLWIWTHELIHKIQLWLWAVIP